MQLANPRSSAPVRGFTVLEMLVVLAVAAVIAAVSMASFTSFTADQRARATATDLVVAMLTARSEAIKRNTNVRVIGTVVSGSTNWGRGWVVQTAGGAQIETLDASGRRLTSPSTGTTEITFNSAGRSTAGGTVQIQLQSVDAGSGAPRCIVVDLSGRPQINRGACV